MTASSGSVTGAATVTITVRQPGMFRLLSPDGGPEVDPAAAVVFTWEMSSDAASYLFELALDEAFTNVIRNEPGLTAPTHELSPGDLAGGSTFYWRVTAHNDSGSTVAGNAPLSFTTVTPPEADYDLLGCRAGRRAVPPAMLFVTLFLLALRSERSRARANPEVIG